MSVRLCPSSTREGAGYRHELGEDADHERLAEALQATRCSVVLSGYPSPLYDRLYAGWRRVEMGSQTCRGGAAKATTEVLWIKEVLNQTRDQRAQLSLL
ncbi:MAG: hypothetical protein ACRDJG_00470 [Actinomycetota bacterium]